MVHQYPLQAQTLSFLLLSLLTFTSLLQDVIVNATTPSDASSCSGLKNSALVFIKPHANTPATQTLVKDALQKAGISILDEVEIDAQTIDQKKLIDQHYYAIASKATMLSPNEIPVPNDQFQQKFKESYQDVLQQNKAANAVQACRIFNVTPEQLNQVWRQAESKDKIIKLGGGFYCGLLTVNEKSLYVFNAFFMNMRSKFVQPGTSIYCYEVEWDPNNLSWKDFRGKVVGPTDPSAAPKGAIRRMILDKYKELGLEEKPNKGENGVHASASPLEGLTEKANWLQRKIKKEAFGKALLDSGISQKTIEEWSLDPQVKLPEGETGSIFDFLEDSNVDDALQKMIQLHKLQ